MMYDQMEQNPVIRTIKAMLTSPLFLVGTIGYSVYALFELLGGVTGGSGLNGIINRILMESGYYDYGLDYGYISGYMSAYNGIRVMGVLVSLIPVILIVAGMWLMFASAKGKQSGLKTTGLTIIRVIVIIQLVCACIGLVVLELVCILAMAGAGTALDYYGGDASLSFLIIFVMIGIAVFFGVQIIYYLKLGKTVCTMREVIVTGRPDAAVSLYVEIICYLGAAAAVLSGLAALAGMSIYGLLSNAGLATANIGFAIFLRKYRDNMEMLIGNSWVAIYAQSGQPQPMQQPVQPMPQQPVQQQPVQQQPVQQQPAQPQPVQAQSFQQPETDNETTVLPYYNETSVLSAQLLSGGRQQLVRMTRQRTGETICISKPSFWIGKDAANVDYCITDNTAVSRRHALVTIQNNGCYIRDNHSTNRVFVNGQVIEPDADVLLSDGDRVRMGDEEFIVSIS